METSLILPIGKTVVITKGDEEYEKLSQALGDFDSVTFLAGLVNDVDHVIMTIKGQEWPYNPEHTEELHALDDIRRHLKYSGSYTFLPVGGDYVRVRFEDVDY